MWLSARFRSSGEPSDLPLPIDIRPVRGAKRLRLRIDEANGRLKLTCPPRTSRRAALAWAFDQREWIEAQLARALPAVPFTPGAIIPVEGRDVRLVWRDGAPRKPELAESELSCGGPLDGFARRIDQFVKRLALEVMSRDVAIYCAMAGVTPAKVTVGDAATRWGSCSSARAIRLSWRLILAPPNVRRFVVAHEVAHLVHLNHSDEFKALEGNLFGPGLAEAKADLRRLGPGLRRIGRRR